MLTVYTRNYCPFCDSAKQYLKDGNIDFVEINAYDDKDAATFLRERGHRTVPQIYLDDKLFVGGGCDGLMALSYTDIRDKLNGMDFSKLTL